jgi:hypothetical protein
MARGRMLNRSVSLSIKFNRLEDDSCRLLATWLIPHLDYRGVFYADADIVKGQVMPMRIDLTLERVEHYLQDMQRVGLLELFQHDDRRWMFWPGFTHNQTLRAGKEKTDFPLPPADGQLRDMTNQNDSPPTGGPRADNGQSTGGPLPEKCVPNEDKGREIEGKDVAAEPASAHLDHNKSFSNATEPKAESAPTMTPAPQTDIVRAGTMSDYLYGRAMQAKANPALAKVRGWDLAPHLTGICEDYVNEAKGTVVTASDKGLFSAGAKDIYDLFTASGKAYSRAWMVEAIRTANWSHAHPRAIEASFRLLLKSNWRPADAPDDDGFVSAGFRHNADGTVTQLVKQVARA